MKILLIAYAFPPLLEPQSLRWAYLTRELADLGHEIDVFTISLPGTYDDLLDLISPRMRIFRVYPGIIEGLFFKAKSRLLGPKTAYSDIRKSNQFLLLRFLYRILRKFSNWILVPDLRTEWFVFAYRRLRNLISSHPYDVILSSHEPGIDHIFGYFAKKWGGSRWVGDFGDPLVTAYTPRFRRPIDGNLEKFLLKRMDGVILTNERLKEKFLGKYPFLREGKVIAIPQGFEASPSCVKRERNRAFTLSYFGAFYQDFRSPENFAKALRRLENCKVKFVLAGRDESFLKYFYGLDGRFEYKGLIPHREALALQRESDLLINFANRQDYQIPGKGYEYLGAMKPILQISDAEDEFSLLIKKLNRGLVVRNQEREIADSIKYLYDLWAEDKIDTVFDLSPDGVRDYSWEILARKVDQFLKNEIAHRRPGSET